MPLINPLDAVWLWAETASNSTHVTGVQVFGPPPSGTSVDELVERLHTEITDPSRLKPAFRRRPVRSWSTAGQFVWDTDGPIDLTAHVARVRLPAPGGRTELHDHVARFHGEHLLRDRPLWRAHLVDGLDDGGFALVTKVHHAMFDGVAASRQLLQGLSTDPDGPATAPWLRRADRPAGARSRPPAAGARELVRDAVLAPWWLPAVAARSAAALASAGVWALTGAGSVPYAAPATGFNGDVDTVRRFGGGSASLSRLRALAASAGVSTNDVVLATCAGGLRRQLQRTGALPTRQLTALIPVSRRDRRDTGTSQGNAITSVICGLATDEPDPRQRLRRIHEVMRRNKVLATSVDGVTAAGIMGVTMGGALLATIPAVPLLPRPAFNLTISTVPGRPEPLYWHGCPMVEIYPASIVGRGQGLNITLVTHGGRIAVGITACRSTGIDPEELVDDLTEALLELESVFATSVPVDASTAAVTV